MSEWKEFALGEICARVITGGTPDTKNKDYYMNGIIPWIKTKEVNYQPIIEAETHITQVGLDNSSAKMIPVNSIIISQNARGRSSCGIPQKRRYKARYCENR